MDTEGFETVSGLMILLSAVLTGMQVQAEDYYNENPGAAANIIDGAIVYLFCIECNVRGAAASRSQKSSATWRLLCPEFAYPRFTACSAPIFTTCLPLFSSRVPTSLLAPVKVRIVAEGSHPLRYFVGESFLPELKHVMEGTAVDWGERWEASTWDVRARCEREGTCTRRAGLVARVVRALCSGAVGRFLFYKRRARGCPFLDASASGIIAACVCANAFAFLGPCCLPLLPRRRWNCFDFFISYVSLVFTYTDLGLGAAADLTSSFRLLRALRLLSLMQRFEELKVSRSSRTALFVLKSVCPRPCAPASCVSFRVRGRFEEHLVRLAGLPPPRYAVLAANALRAARLSRPATVAANVPPLL